MTYEWILPNVEQWDFYIRVVGAYVIPQIVKIKICGGTLSFKYQVNFFFITIVQGNFYLKEKE